MRDRRMGPEAAGLTDDEVRGKSGRSLVPFQQAEFWLKWLAARRRSAAMSGEFEAVARMLRDQAAKETTGGVALRVTAEVDLSAKMQERIAAVEDLETFQQRDEHKGCGTTLLYRS